MCVARYVLYILHKYLFYQKWQQVIRRFPHFKQLEKGLNTTNWLLNNFITQVLKKQSGKKVKKVGGRAKNAKSTSKHSNWEIDSQYIQMVVWMIWIATLFRSHISQGSVCSWICGCGGNFTFCQATSCWWRLSRDTFNWFDQSDPEKLCSQAPDFHQSWPCGRIFMLENAIEHKE